MLAAGKSVGEVLQSLEISEPTPSSVASKPPIVLLPARVGTVRTMGPDRCLRIINPNRESSGDCQFDFRFLVETTASLKLEGALVA